MLFMLRCHVYYSVHIVIRFLKCVFEREMETTHKLIPLAHSAEAHSGQDQAGAKPGNQELNSGFLCGRRGLRYSVCVSTS